MRTEGGKHRLLPVRCIGPETGTGKFVLGGMQHCCISTVAGCHTGTLILILMVWHHYSREHRFQGIWAQHHKNHGLNPVGRAVQKSHTGPDPIHC